MQNLTSVVDEQIANNRNHRQAMSEAIASGEVIAFVGAGLSASLKYPAWPYLLSILQIRAKQLAAFTPTETAKNDALQYAEEISNHFKANGAILEFNNILGREFAPRQIGANCAPTHDRLVKLPFRTFITTNYDSCLETALAANAFANHSTPSPDSGVIIKASGADCHRVPTSTARFTVPSRFVTGNRNQAGLPGLSTMWAGPFPRSEDEMLVKEGGGPPRPLIQLFMSSNSLLPALPQPGWETMRFTNSRNPFHNGVCAVGEKFSGVGNLEMG